MQRFLIYNNNYNYYNFLLHIQLQEHTFGDCPFCLFSTRFSFHNTLIYENEPFVCCFNFVDVIIFVFMRKLLNFKFLHFIINCNLKLFWLSMVPSYYWASYNRNIFNFFLSKISKTLKKLMVLNDFKLKKF